MITATPTGSLVSVNKSIHFDFEITATPTGSLVSVNKSNHFDFENILLQLPDLVYNFKAGRLKDYYNFWSEITSDRDILNNISGMKLELNHLPMQWCLPKEYNFTESEKLFLSDEINKLLKKGVIIETEYESGDFCSNIFLREKKDGTYRLILNLKKLNESIEYHHFKMDTLKSAINLMTKNCYMASIDWKDAYYSVPIHKSHQRYLKFSFDGKFYQFTCLPNGCASGPRVFTKITKPLFSKLRKMGHLNSIYIDDSFLVGQTHSECLDNVIDTTILSLKAGFIVHPEKSVFKPTQIIEFLGFILNSILMITSLTSDKALHLKQLCIELLNSDRPNIRQVAKVVGKMVAAFPGVEFGPLYYRKLDNDKSTALKINRGNYEAKTILSEQSKLDLKWWIENIENNCKKISQGNPHITVHSDASMTGWGGCYGNKKTGGNWSKNESKIHINILELIAAWYTLASLCDDMRNTHIRLMIDNQTALAYINAMGGKRSQCNRITRKIWEWCIQRGIWLSAAYIKSKDNIIADSMSRINHKNSEWKLSEEIFQQITNEWGPPDIDLFASRLNNQLPKYVAWKPDPFAFAVDAFSLAWTEGLMYIFPPFAMIGKVLQKNE